MTPMRSFLFHCRNCINYINSSQYSYEATATYHRLECAASPRPAARGGLLPGKQLYDRTRGPAHGGHSPSRAPGTAQETLPCSLSHPAESAYTIREAGTRKIARPPACFRMAREKLSL